MSYFWRTHKGVKVLYADYRLLNSQQILTQLREIKELASNSHEPIKVLANIENVALSSKILPEVHEMGKEVVSEKKIQTGVIGMAGYKRIIFKIYITVTKDITKPFNSEEAVLNYLAAN
ncbi:hypothetical protein OAH12_01255 [Cyclobacteriaceae bacterium]|nr:hypothetical protein [Cyclobacteriaceae bacterium]